MNSPSSKPATEWHGVPAVPVADRLPSLDAFRGFVIATMVFVNNLGDGVPPWMKHMPTEVDGYTFVDLVFPGFLFMVGFSIPLSFASKLAQGVTFLKLSWRVLARAAMLISIGLIMINAESEPLFNEAATGMGKSLWTTLAYLSLIFLNLARPKGAGALRVKVQTILKIISLLVLAYLLVIYRSSGPDGHPAWLQHSWWGIIGLIGWAYLGSGLFYLTVRGDSTALMGFLGFLIAMYVGIRNNMFTWMGPLELFSDQLFGSGTVIVTAGALVGSLFVGKEKKSVQYRVLFLFLFGVGLYLAGTLLRPLYGISKNLGTISYSLVAPGICCGVYLFFYWVLEIAKKRSWAEWTLIPVGQNALMAYLLSEGIYSFYRVVAGQEIPWFGDYLTAVLHVLVICTAAWLLTKAKVTLRL